MYSSYQISLEEFISPIPICQHGCALETILNASQSSQNGTIAIVDRQQFPLGVVTAHSLLSLLVQYQHNCRITTLVGSQKYFEDRAALMATTNLQSLIEPVKIVNYQASISEFLDYSSNGNDRRGSSYALVDEREKFLGMLDTQKLFEFLLENNQPQPQALGSELSFYLFSLMEKIPLPLTIQEGGGKILYQNHYWQQHLSELRDRDAIDYSSQLAQWWLGQLTSQPNQLSSESNSRERNDLPLVLADSATAGEIPTDSSSNSNSAATYAERSIFTASGLQISYINGWYYVKMPLDFATSQTRQHWLVVAIAAENEQSRQTISADADWSRLKDEFLAYITHELKSPLTGIVGLSNLLKAQKLGNLNQRQIRYVELIYRSGKRLTKMVNDLLKLTGLTPDKQSFFVEPLELEPLCRQTYRHTLTELETTAETDSSEISAYPQLELAIAPGSETAFFDKSCLTQILSCLLERAVQSQAKRIGIKVNSWTDWITIVVWHQTEEVAVSATPTDGCQEAETNDSKAEYNKNLNLAIARQLAKAHGGELSSVSTASGRNEFTLLLPHVAVGDRLESSNSKSNGKRLLVLIIETLPHRIARIASTIEDLGYYLVVARSGIEALQQARRLKPSYILMNPACSLLGGKDLLTLLESDSSTQNIPVFVLTTPQHKLEDSQTFRQAQGVICEPFDRATLAQILPVKDFAPPVIPQNITILCIYPELKVIDQTREAENLDFSLKDWAERDWSAGREDRDQSRDNVGYRIIEADGLEQAQMLARIWQLDVVILDSVAIKEPLDYLRSLRQSSYLASLPLIILDSKTSAAANQIDNLTVYPCLLPAKSRSIRDLMQVIQIAAKTKNSRSSS